MKTHRLLSPRLSIALLVGLIAPFVNAFEQPLPESEQCRFRETVQQQKLSELAQQLEMALHHDKKRLIVEELGRRKNSDAEVLLAQLVDKIGNRIQQSEGKDPESEMLLASTLVELARVRSGDIEDNYFAKLENLLLTGNSFVQTAAAVELENIGSTRASMLLLKYEAEPNISPVVKIERLKIDYWNLNNKDFVQAILKSAQTQIAKGDTRLIAERTILMQRGMYEGARSLAVEKEIINPSLPSQIYLQFLKETRERLRACEDRYYPGLTALVNLYNSRNNEASTELQKIYLDDDRYWRYRKKAYELFLALEMERFGLTEPEAKIKYLLSNLDTIGEGHSSDWKDNSKTLKAIKDAAITRKLIEYGGPVEPHLDLEFRNSSPSINPRRHKALLYIKKHIRK